MSRSRSQAYDFEQLLGEDCPDFAATGASAVVPFEATRLRDAEVLWINERWLGERGVDVAVPGRREEVVEWLRSSFGFCVPQAFDAPAAFFDEKKTFVADRYGGGRHGGSGRAGLCGRFQVKGIGATPLVGDVTDWGYSHGCLWLEEAIRECIYAELIDAEFPHGGVPVIAILDTGLSYHFPDGRVGERRALIVRPAVVRPAHLERATQYRADIGGRAEQLADVERTKEWVQAFTAGEIDGADAADLSLLVTRIVEQIAYGRANRLFHGGYFTSNLAINGALHDFGSFRATPDWAKAYCSNHLPPFGSEASYLKTLVHSLVFHLNKFQEGGRPKLDGTALLEDVTKKLEVAVDLNLLKIWGAEDMLGTAAGSAITGACRRYFEHQQRFTRSHEKGLGANIAWLDECLLQLPQDTAHLVHERELLLTVDRALREALPDLHHDGKWHGRVWDNALRRLLPRWNLFREHLQGRIFSFLENIETVAIKPEALAAFISEALTFGRREWPNLPERLRVSLQATEDGSDALYCTDPVQGTSYLWLEGSVCNGFVRLFGTMVPIPALAPYEGGPFGTRYGVLLPHDHKENVQSVGLAGHAIKLPFVKCLYPAAVFFNADEKEEQRELAPL
jgi:hypothetical protein